MRVHVLQHVPFEGIGSIRQWLEERSALVSTTRLYEQPALPVFAEPDLESIGWFPIWKPASEGPQAIARSIQSEAEMLARPARFDAINRLMESILSFLAELSSS